MELFNKFIKIGFKYTIMLYTNLYLHVMNSFLLSFFNKDNLQFQKLRVS